MYLHIIYKYTYLHIIYKKYIIIIYNIHLALDGYYPQIRDYELVRFSKL